MQGRPKSGYGCTVEPSSAHDWPDKSDEPASTVSRDGDAYASETVEHVPSRRRRNLLTCGVFFLALCLVSGVVAFMLYDRATRKDRGTPNVVVFQYIDAIFDQRDPSEAKLFECKASNGRAALDALLSEIEEREQRFDIRISVSTGTKFDTSVEGKSAQVKVDLIVTAPEANGERSRSTQFWQFDLRDEDGWRVCSAQRVP